MDIWQQAKGRLNLGGIKVGGMLHCARVVAVVSVLDHRHKELSKHLMTRNKMKRLTFSSPVLRKMRHCVKNGAWPRSSPRLQPPSPRSWWRGARGCPPRSGCTGPGSSHWGWSCPSSGRTRLGSGQRPCSCCASSGQGNLHCGRLKIKWPWMKLTSLQLSLHTRVRTWVGRASSFRRRQLRHWGGRQTPVFPPRDWPSSPPCCGHTSRGWRSLPCSLLWDIVWWKDKSEILFYFFLIAEF